jgi:predicted NBD/HSP70 family sugar kinase
MSSFFQARSHFEKTNSSEGKILGVMLRQGPITQSVLASETNLTQQSISRIVTRLIGKGMIQGTSRIAEGKRGQSSLALEIVPNFAYSIGIAVMADTISMVVMDFSGKVIDQQIMSMVMMKPDAVIKIVKEKMLGYVESGLLQKNKVCGVGVGVTGYFVEETSSYNTPPSLPDWAFLNVEELFSEALELPVWSDNDGSTAALGESMIGVGRWANNFAYLYLSSGFGGGIVQDGKLNRGVRGNAGEFAGILPYNIYTHPTMELLRQIICKNGVQIDSVYQLVTEFDPEWPGIDEWVMKVKDSLSLVVSAISAILDNDAIVIGGRIPKVLAEKVIPYLEFSSMARRGKRRPLPKLVAAEAEGEPTAIGAASLPFNALFFC